MSAVRTHLLGRFDALPHQKFPPYGRAVALEAGCYLQSIEKKQVMGYSSLAGKLLSLFY
jgi:hypothetical protein